MRQANKYKATAATASSTGSAMAGILPWTGKPVSGSKPVRFCSSRSTNPAAPKHTLRVETEKRFIVHILLEPGDSPADFLCSIARFFRFVHEAAHFSVSRRIRSFNRNIHFRTSKGGRSHGHLEGGCLKGKSELFRLRFVLFNTVRSTDFPLFPSMPVRFFRILGQKWVSPTIFNNVQKYFQVWQRF